ncbi:MAG: anti-sigma factor family protein [Myxococcales bacterium]|jgi:anti-sigma factor RsiW
MDCPLIRGDLVAYHFGSVEEATRDAVESHLLGCPDCLRAFLALKREIETAGAGPRPSPAARARLRQAVAHELASRAGAPSPHWWRRPLAFGFVTAAAAAAMLLVLSVRGQMHLMAQIAESAPVEVRGPAPAVR